MIRYKHGTQSPDNPKAFAADKQAVKADLIEQVSSLIGVPVVVRLQPDLLAKLDELRGGLTRPEAIRRLLRSTQEERLS